MANNTACIDPEYIRLIVQSVIQEMLNKHQLQAGLKNCDDGWLGHENEVVKCDVLVDMIQDAIDDGALSGYSEAPITGDGTEDDPYTLDESKLKDIISSVFLNCEGNQLPQGTKLMSCDQINHAIDDAVQQTRDEMDEIPRYKNCEGNELPDGTQLMSCEDVCDSIDTAVDSAVRSLDDAIPRLNNKEGNPIADGTNVMSAEEVGEAIEHANSELLEGGCLTPCFGEGFAGEGGCEDPKRVDKDWLKDTIQEDLTPVQIVECPDSCVGEPNCHNVQEDYWQETHGASLPTTIIGTKGQDEQDVRSAILGRPDKFMKVTLPGPCGDEEYLMPLFKV